MNSVCQPLILNLLSIFVVLSNFAHSAENHGVATLRSLVVNGSYEHWGTIYVKEKKIGWEHNILKEDSDKKRFVLNSEVHYQRGASEIVAKARTYISNQDLSLLGYEYTAGGRTFKGEVKAGRLHQTSPKGGTVKLQLSANSITTYGLWMWALALPQKRGQSRRVELIHEWSPKPGPKGTLQISGREGVTKKKVQAWKVELPLPKGPGYAYWISEDRDMLKGSYGGPTSFRATDGKKAQAGIKD